MAIALSLLALVLSVFAASAQAQIVVGQGGAGIKLDYSKAKVRSVLGAPFRTEPTFMAWDKPCSCLVEFRRGKASSIDFASKTERTVEGVGVKTSFEKVRETYPEAKCHHPQVYGETSQLCVLRSTYKGRSVRTIFAFYEKDLGVRDIEIRFG